MNNARGIALQVLLGFLAFALFEGLVCWAFQPQGTEVRKWQVEGPSVSCQQTAPFGIPFKEQGIYRLTATFPRTQDDLFVVPRPLGHTIQVEVNGDVIGKMGDIRTPTANTWNSTFAFPLPKSCSEGESRVAITMYGLHDAGLAITPYTANSQLISSRLDMQKFLTQGCTWITFGMAFALIVLLLILALSVPEKRLSYILLMVSCIFCVIYNLDTIERIQTFSMEFFLIWRKVVLSSIFLASTTAFIGIYLFYDRKGKDLLIQVVPLIALPILIFSKDFISLQTAFFYSVEAVICLIPIFVFRERRMLNGYLMFGLSFLIFCSIQSVLIMFKVIAQPYLTSLGITIFLLGIATVLIQRAIQLEWETKALREEAIRDPLTGLLGRKYLKNTVLREKDAIFFMDLDDFKEINDREGHAEGDRLLIRVAEALMAETRGADDVIRFGGDELVIIFREVGDSDLASCVRRIETRLVALVPSVAFSYGVAEGSLGLERAVELADQRMYEMKRVKKERNLVEGA